MRNPETPEEWQEAVNSAKLLLLIHDCILYGLIKGPTVNAERCEQILREGAQRGYLPLSTETLIEKAFKNVPGGKGGGRI